MNGIGEFAESVRGFYNKTSVDRMLLLAWYLESIEGRSSFDSSALRESFEKVGCEPPNIGMYLTRLSKKRPPQVVKASSGYRLASNVRRSLDQKIGGSPSVVAVSKLLSDLPKKVPNVGERDFLTEALNCYKVKAYRAAIVMAWNLAYDHIIEWLLSDATRLDRFRKAIEKRFPRKVITICSRDDFEELKEFETILILRSARLLNKNAIELL